MDVFNRSLRGWHLRRNLDRDLTLKALKKALRNVDGIHQSNRGLRNVASDYINMMRTAQVKITNADLGAAWQNSCSNGLIRTIREEESQPR